MMENDECGLDTARCGIDIMFGLCSTHALHGPVVEWDIRHSLTLQRRDAGYGMDTLAWQEVSAWEDYYRGWNGNVRSAIILGFPEEYLGNTR